MTDIDLIPAEYRKKQWQRGRFRVFAGILGVVMVINLAGWASGSYFEKKVTKEVQQLQEIQTATDEQRNQLTSLSGEKRRYEQQLELLTGLRSGGAAVTMFQTLDRALEDQNVWFLDWHFQRAGVVVSTNENTLNTGYFIIVPKGTDTSGDQPWKVQTHMTIKGQARDHDALSRFVRQLFAQQEIDDVRVQRTTQRRWDNTPIIQFDLAVVLNTNVETGS